jgi:hypothetical protein
VEEVEKEEFIKFLSASFLALVLYSQIVSYLQKDSIPNVLDDGRIQLNTVSAP